MASDIESLGLGDGSGISISGGSEPCVATDRAIPLAGSSGRRFRLMSARVWADVPSTSEPSPAPEMVYAASLEQLSDASQARTACNLYRCAIQVVFDQVPRQLRDDSWRAAEERRGPRG